MAKRQRQVAPAAPAIPAPEQQPEQPVQLPSRSIVPVGYRERCERDRVNRTIGGNVSVDSGDALAKFLRGKSVEQVADLCAEALGVPAAVLLARYAKLNKGQQRMNLGNRLRAALKDGTWQLPTEVKVEA